MGKAYTGFNSSIYSGAEYIERAIGGEGSYWSPAWNARIVCAIRMRAWSACSA